jgi:frataxin-like iron-binding protein CyaY
MPSDEIITLVAEGNIAKINQRFKELEDDIRDVRAYAQELENSIGNLNQMIQNQTNMIQQVWVAKNGTGAV